MIWRVFFLGGGGMAACHTTRTKWSHSDVLVVWLCLVVGCLVVFALVPPWRLYCMHALVLVETSKAKAASSTFPDKMVSSRRDSLRGGFYSCCCCVCDEMKLSVWSDSTSGAGVKPLDSNLWAQQEKSKQRNMERRKERTMEKGEA